MFFSWLKERRRRQLLREPVPASWQAPLAALPFHASLEEDQRSRLLQHARILVAEKNWEGCRGQELTEAVQVIIAVQACRLILNLPHEAYRGVTSILVYPAAFRTEDTEWYDGVTAAGLASPEGPVVLAWDSAYEGGRDPHDGKNVVYHEFAHKLDGLDGEVDGVPPLGSDRSTWRGILEREFETLCRATARRKATLLDDYGATNPGEFFAVATECFFEQSEAMRKRHPELYGVLAAFYRQNPAAPASERATS